MRDERYSHKKIPFPSSENETDFVDCTHCCRTIVPRGSIGTTTRKDLRGSREKHN